MKYKWYFFELENKFKVNREVFEYWIDKWIFSKGNNFGCINKNILNVKWVIVIIK